MSFFCWLRNERAAMTLAAALVAAVGVVRADTFSASGAGGLVNAINAANKAGGGHTIVLAAGASFELKSANNSTYGPTGLPVIGGAKTVDITIVGNGATIKRAGDFSYNKRGLPNNPFRLLAVAAGATLTMDNVKLSGGWAHGSGVAASGGAVYNQGTLNLRNGAVFSVNYAGHGGAVYNAGGTVSISDSRFVSGSIASGKTVVTFGNSAGYGGAIYNNGGALTISKSSLSGGGANWFGGAIYSNGGIVVVNNSKLSLNGARFGGGIYNDRGSLTLSNGCIVSDNEAYHSDYPWTGGDGGGLYNAGGTVTVRDFSTITGNTSDALGADVYNPGELYLDTTSTIGLLDGVPAIPF